MKGYFKSPDFTCERLALDDLDYDSDNNDEFEFEAIEERTAMIIPDHDSMSPRLMTVALPASSTIVRL